MDFMADLVIKAIELGAATYATKTLSSASSADGVRGAVPNFAALPEQLRKLLESAEETSEKLPNYLDDTTPENRKWVKLGMCLIIDLIGSGSLPIPLLADALDIAWAPISALCLQALFGNGLITAAGFAEEFLPGTDGIPTATLAWVNEHYGDAIRKIIKESNATDVPAKQVEEKRQPFGGAFSRKQKASRR